MKTKMYNLFLSALGLVHVCAVAAQTTYYLSSNGDDAHLGTSPALAWRTLAHASSFKGYQPGDTLLLRAGDVFRGTLALHANGLVIASYGRGDRPEIWGSETISGRWTTHAGNIYKTPYNGRPSFVFVDGIPHMLARSPDNNRYHLVTQAPNCPSPWVRDTSFVGYAYNLAGAYISLRQNNWTVTTRLVTAFDHSTGTITLNEPIHFQGCIFAPGWGFILSNKLQFLDSPREFFVDQESNQLYLWTYNGSVPSNAEASVHDFGIRTTSEGKSNITVSDIVFRYQAVAGILLFDGSENISVSGCAFYHMPFGITNRQGKDSDGYCRPRATRTVFFSDNYLEHMYKAAVKLDNTTASVVQNNILVRISTIVNAAEWLNFPCGEFNESGFGINTVGNNSIVRGNKISVCGHYGIWVGNNGIVENNCLDSCCTLYSDCGAIYRYYDHLSQAYGNPPGGWKQVEIRNNTISNTNSNHSGVNPQGSASSIYIDHRTGSPLVNNNFIPDSLVIENNAVIHGLTGLASTGIARALIRNNVFYGCTGPSVGIATLDPYSHSQTLRKYHFYRNVFFSDGFHRQVSFYNSNPNNPNYDFCTADSNYYIAPFHRFLFYVRRSTGFLPGQFQDEIMDMDAWRNFGKDINGQYHAPVYAHCKIKDTLAPGNFVRNSAFDQNHIIGWSCYPTQQNNFFNYMSIARDTVAALGGHALKATFTHSAGTLYPVLDCRLFDAVKNTELVNLSPATYYIISFDIYSTAKKTLTFSILSDENSETVFGSVDVEVKANVAQRHFHIFKPTHGAMKAKLRFSGRMDNDYTYFLDNVHLIPVEASCIDPAQKFPLFANCSSEPVTVSLSPNCYKDLDGRLVTGALRLAPYSAAVFEWLPDTVCLISHTGTAFKKSKRLLIYPNPAREFVTLESNAETGLLRIYNAYGQTVGLQEIHHSPCRLGIGHLPAGIYLIEMLGSADGPRQTATITKCD